MPSNRGSNRLTRLLALASCLGLLAAPAVLAQSGGGTGSSQGGTGAASSGATTTGNTGGTAGGGAGSGAAASSQDPNLPPSVPPTTVVPLPGDTGTERVWLGGPGEPGGQTQQDQIREQMREAGVAAPTEVREEQLEELNAITREIAPSVPIPAPSVAPDRQRN